MKGWVVGAVALVTSLVGCAGGPDMANIDSSGTAIIAFGDSLTYGEGASGGHDYPSLLSRHIGRDVINAGVNGETSRGALQRLQSDVLSQHPLLVIVEFGGNDFLQRLPRAETFANLDAIVRRIQEKGAMVVLASVPPGLIGDATRGEFLKIAKARRAALRRTSWMAS